MEIESARQPEPLHVSSTATDGVTVVRVVGEIDHASAGPLIETLDLDALSNQPRLVIDMRGVSFMDSSGINVLLAAHHDLAPAGWLRLAGVRDSVLRTLKIVGVDTVIPCHPNLKEALTG